MRQLNSLKPSQFNRINTLFMQRYERYLPTAFDESTSILEKINKLIDFLNTVVEHLNTQSGEIEEWQKELLKNLNLSLDEYETELDRIKQEYENFREMIINDLLPESVTNKMEEWLENGTIYDLINEVVFGNINERLEKLEEKVSTLTVDLKQFGAKGDGITDDSNALTSALSYLKDNSGGKLTVPEGEYLTKGVFDVDSNIVIEGQGPNSVFTRDNRSMMFRINGSLDPEIPVSQNSELGDNFITVNDPSKFELNDYIKIVSQRNALSKEDNTDDYYLGQATNSAGSDPHKLYFGEIRKISAKNDTTGQLFFRGGLIFPDYLTHNNNEIDKTKRKNATVFKTNFVENVVFKDLTFKGDFSNVMRFDTAKNCVVDNCHWIDAIEQSFVTFHNSFMCEARNSRVDYTANYTPPVDNSRNPFKSVSSVNTGFDNVQVLYGTQCVDFTYSTDNGGIPNQNSYLTNSRMIFPIYDGISIHPGTLNALVSNNEFINCHADGIFNRSKKALIMNNVVTGSQSNSDVGSSYGIKVSHDSMQGTVVQGNNVEGFKIGLGTRDNVNTEIKKVNLTISGNSFSRINVGVQLRRNSGSTFVGDSNVRIVNNVFTNFVAQYAKGVDIYDHYFNIFIENNFFEFNKNVNAGVYTRGNASKIFVDGNLFTGYSTSRSLLYFGDVTDPNINSRAFSFNDNKFDGLRVTFEDMRTGNLSNGYSNHFYSNVMPAETNVVSLGSPSFRWRYLYSQNAPDVVSDKRLKDNVKNEKFGLDIVNQFRPVTYTMGDDTTVKHGLIAQEVEKIINDGSIVRKPDNESEYYSMQYEQLIPIIIKAIQELNDKIE